MLSRDNLLDLTRGRVVEPFDRSIDVQVSRLRTKIEEDSKKTKNDKNYTQWRIYVCSFCKILFTRLFADDREEASFNF